MPNMAAIASISDEDISNPLSEDPIMSSIDEDVIVLVSSMSRMFSTVSGLVSSLIVTVMSSPSAVMVVDLTDVFILERIAA